MSGVQKKRVTKKKSDIDSDMSLMSKWMFRLFQRKYCQISVNSVTEPFTAAVTDKAASLRIAATAVVARLAILHYALNKERWYNSDRRAKWHHLWVLLGL